MPVLTRRNGFFYAWIFILADPEEARKYSATIHVGEGTQSGLIHRGGVVSIDVKRDDILKMRSGVVSFAQSGMGHSFFRHLKTGEKEIQVSYVIESSGVSKQLLGLGELLRMKEEGAAPSSPKHSSSESSKGASSRARGLWENRGDSENEGSISEDEQANSENRPSEDENANSEDENGNSEDERNLSEEERISSGSEDEQERANSEDEGTNSEDGDTNSEGNRSPPPSPLPPTPRRSDQYPETSMDRLWSNAPRLWSYPPGH